MDNQKKAYKHLMKKKIKDLVYIAGSFDPPIILKPTWTKDKITKLILERQNIPVKAPDHIEQGPVNPDFEAAAQVDEPVKEKRGGVRPGAGRTPGMTDEKAKVRHLPQVPSTPIKQGCQSLFDFWASAAKIEELALTDDEAETLSLPITQLQEYYFPGILPEIAGTWIMLIFAVSRVVKPRIDKVNVVRKHRKETRVQSSLEDRTPRHYQYKDGDSMKPLHAIIAGEPAAFTDELDNVTCPTCLEVIEKARP